MLARHPFLISLGICILAAAAETILAGKHPIKFLATLRQPHFAPPLWLWTIIGVFYYLICFLVLARLLHVESGNMLRDVAVALILALLAINAFFNYVLFRMRNLFASLAVFAAYDLIAIALTMSLLLLDKTAALVFIAYPVYLIFANCWAYQLWRLNQPTYEKIRD
jgi:Tryptophan-rich sensory protein (mitochondrial benzodiazepine receptor homolog)